ncbi:hypothetical protein C7M84_021503 [Penaeus vannamei]|uniref:Uncharacterized protein n=1 Tax=Penaeus vannamei TaxID=6689 RepID=A0A423S9L2_PENVA|nr:hypothetical protein C7M84_021503 [Penaeus vannamei]
MVMRLLVLVLVGAVCAVTEEENPVLPGLAVRAETTFLFSSTVTVIRTLQTQVTTLATCVVAASNLPSCSARAEPRYLALVPTAFDQRYEFEPEAGALNHLEPSFESGLLVNHERILEFLPPVGLLTVVTKTAWEIMVTATVSHPTDTFTISLAGCVPTALPFSAAACVATGTTTSTTTTTPAATTPTTTSTTMTTPATTSPTTTSTTTTTPAATTPTTTSTTMTTPATTSPTTTSTTTTTPAATTPTTTSTTMTTPATTSPTTTSTTTTTTPVTTTAATTTSTITSSTPPMSPSVVHDSFHDHSNFYHDISIRRNCNNDSDCNRNGDVDPGCDFDPVSDVDPGSDFYPCSDLDPVSDLDPGSDFDPGSDLDPSGHPDSPLRGMGTRRLRTCLSYVYVYIVHRPVSRIGHLGIPPPFPLSPVPSPDRRGAYIDEGDAAAGTGHTSQGPFEYTFLAMVMKLLVLVLVGAVCAVTEEENPVLPGLAVRAETTFLFSSTVTVIRTLQTQVTTLATCVVAASNLPSCSARAEPRYLALVPTAFDQRYEFEPEAGALNHLEPSFESGLLVNHERILRVLATGWLADGGNQQWLTAWEIMVTATSATRLTLSRSPWWGSCPRPLPFSARCLCRDKEVDHNHDYRYDYYKCKLDNSHYSNYY